MSKQKNDVRDLIGTDGELIVPFPTKVTPRKRKDIIDEHSPRSQQAWQLWFGCLWVLVLLALICLLAVFFIADEEQGQPESVVEAVILEISTATVTPSDTPITQATLPPSWTPLPSNTPTQTHTPAPPTVTPLPSATSFPTATTTPRPFTYSKEMDVLARAEWQGTGLLVRSGDFITVEYLSGEWQPWAEVGPFGPDGAGAFTCLAEDCVEPIYGYPQAGMIGRVGADGNELFKVGYFYSAIQAHGGELFLRMNDAVVHDNEGSIRVKITLERPASEE